ncbi:MAG: hypothetical protein AUK47_23825 [Deltaproteobacteria bacterium CG2_30_63_29]|nr:MAG: hypothetical protein AUK47_23825 [Deltaproteobacteria bacterium CG2_30_63_29]PJB47894.1 MAG: hypothetical protein CO108_03360 [Deltaproteobacteria bacterium CG_4_9_14_3_um_filter_63_12]
MKLDRDRARLWLFGLVEVGQELGAGIHYRPELERWSLAQDTLFAPMLDSEGRKITAFQPAGPNPCEGPP